MPHWIGLDMGVLRTAVCVIDRQGLPVFQEECETTAADISATFKSIPRRSIKAIGVEAGTGTHAIRELICAGLPVKLISPLKASKFLSVNRNKSDVNDARALAELVRVGRLVGAEVHTKRLEAQNIQTLLLIRHHLLRHRLKLEQVLLASLTLNGFKIRLAKRRRSTVEAISAIAFAPNDVTPVSSSTWT